MKRSAEAAVKSALFLFLSFGSAFSFSLPAEDSLAGYLDEGVKNYEAGNYAAAAAAFEKALEIQPGRASTHYNSAVCHEMTGDAGRAARHYRDYLRLAPGAGDRADVVQLIAKLEGAAKPEAVVVEHRYPGGTPLPRRKAEREDALVIKTGAFFCGDECTGNDAVDMKQGWLVGVEYWTPSKTGRKKDANNSVSYEFFYTRTSFDYQGAAVGGDLEYFQFSINHLWSKRTRELTGRGVPEGFYYGLGLGYGVVRVSSSVSIEADGDGLDVNGSVGYVFKGGPVVEGLWVFDEKAWALTAGYAF
ncbi:MAG: tetratricopeptide repeat protein [bacterium]